MTRSKGTPLGSGQRTYEPTHPWLTFEIDLNRLSYQTWINLGAIQSKCEHVGNVMVAPEVGQRLLSLYLAKGVAATTAIEGNTLSEKEVLRRIKTREALPQSKEYQGKEIDNIVDACNLVAKEMIDEARDCTITPEQVKRFNEMVLKGLPVPEGDVPGRIREYSVGVADYRGAPHEDCEYLLERLCRWINNLTSPQNSVAIAVVRAVLAHLYLAWIHPFGDGNGRTARLVEFQIFLGVGMPTVACHLLSNHYNQTRSEYYRQLSLASKTADPFCFIRYAVAGLVDQLDEQIKRIREYQHAVVWKDHVYDKFRNAKSAAAHRQRQLALELGKRKKPCPIAEIQKLSPQLGEAYLGKTRKTTTRDLNALQKLGLIVRHRNLIAANKAALRAFLPRRRDESMRH
ncbi:MAG: Fic family protein [Pirellulaceae bacterium]|jgi:Fic family protein|nr:Fic family protein [Pirellulaceae bacterium]